VPIIREGKSLVLSERRFAGDRQVSRFQLDWAFFRGNSKVCNHFMAAIETRLKALASSLMTSIGGSLVPEGDRLRFLRHKERKFGRGCISQMKAERMGLLRATGATAIPLRKC